MDHPLTPGDREPPRQRRSLRRWLIRGGVGLGVSLVVAGVGGGLWLRYYIRSELTPQIQKSLARLLQRPILVGELQEIGLSGIRFGRSSIPETATESNRAVVEAIKAQFNPWQVVLQRQVHLQLILVEPEVYLAQQVNGTWLTPNFQFTGTQGFFDIQVKSVKIQAGQVTARPMTQAGELLAAIEAVDLEGTVQIQSGQVQARLQGQLDGQGMIQADLEAPLNFQAVELALQGDKLPIPLIPRFLTNYFSLPVEPLGGQGTGQIQLSWVNRRLDLDQIKGTVAFQNVGISGSPLPQPLLGVAGRVRFTGSQLQLEDVTGSYGELQAELAGRVDLKADFDVNAQVKPATIEAALQTLGAGASLPVTGQVIAEAQITGPVRQPLVSGMLQSTMPLEVDRLLFTQASSNFQVRNLNFGSGSQLGEARGDRPPASVQLTDIVLLSDLGARILGGGDIALGPEASATINLRSSALPGDAIAERYGVSLPLILGQLGMQARISGPLRDPEVVVQWQAPESTYPSRGTFRWNRTQLTVEELVAAVAGGVVRATGQQAGQVWTLTAQPETIALNRFATGLRGTLSGQIELTGPRNTFNPGAIRGVGQVEFSQGLSLIRDPLQAQVAWDGQVLQVPKATAPGFQASGTVQANLTGPQAPQIVSYDLDTQLKSYPLESLPFLPTWIPTGGVQGQADFQGQVRGTLSQPIVEGGLVIRDLKAGQVAFETQLQGELQYRATGLALGLRGSQDQVRLTLDRENRPQSFLVQRDQGILRGERQGNALAVVLKHFPIATIQQQFVEPPAGRLWQGLASGQATIALDPLAASGTIAISNPQIDTLRANQVLGDFNYANGVVTLTDSRLIYPESTYHIDGRAILKTGDPRFELTARVEQGSPQDLFQALQWYDVTDILRGFRAPQFATAAQLSASGVGNPQAPFFYQLLRFAEIKSLVARQIAQRQQERRLPPLSDLEGRFDGSLDLQGSLSQGINANFKFEGDNWRWGDFTANNLLIQGEWDDNQLTLLPIEATINDSTWLFSGTFGQQANSGQFQVNDLSLELVDRFIRLPFDVGGKVNVNATVSGSAARPQILGGLMLVDGTLNDVPVETSQTGFNYVNGRLGFGGKLQVDSPEPVEIFGSIPFGGAPGLGSEAADNRITLRVNVANEGLALLNVLTQDRFQWQGGQGQVSLNVGGTVEQPVATGQVTLDSAQLKASFFPEPVKDLSGSIRFINDRIDVETLQGTLSEGQVTAQGVLPIAQPLIAADPDIANRLTLGFDNVDLNLPGRYQGNADGEVVVIGTALQPQLTGKVALSNGQILIPDPTARAASAIASGNNPPDVGIAPIEFRDLELSLEHDVAITQQPIFRFLAEGSLLVNGTFGDLQPRGVIDLVRGQVNLFTTQFALSRRYANRAIFNPEQGLDADLDLRLVASVTESNNGTAAIASPSGSEIVDPGPLASQFGEIQTVRIRAEVDGPTSQLLDSIRLSSSPARSQAEIFNLIGGGFVTTLGQGGDSTLALASLAGSALLNNLQVAINRALAGPVSLRIFPVVVNPDDRQERTDGSSRGSDRRGIEALALGAELGINLTNSLSFSVLRVLTLDIPTQFGLRYQINDNLQLRTSTDFEGDDRVFLEYELRF